MRVASAAAAGVCTGSSSLPQRIPCGLHLRPASSAARALTLPQRIPCGLHLHAFPLGLVQLRLCLSASHAGCILYGSSERFFAVTLPQRIPCGLHPALRRCAVHHVPFASAHPMRVASDRPLRNPLGPKLCLSASHAGCIGGSYNISSDKGNFASAHPMRVASAKMHKIYSMDL